MRDDCLRNNRIRIGFEDNDEEVQVKYFINEMQIGDVVFSYYDQWHTDAIGIITGEYEMLEGETAKFGRCRSLS